MCCLNLAFFLITIELTGVSDLHMTLQTEAMILFFRFVRLNIALVVVTLWQLLNISYEMVFRVSG